MGKSIYKKDIGGFLHLDLEPLHKEAECDYLGTDPNWDKFDNEHWLDHDAIETDVANAVKAALEKHGVSVIEVKFHIDEYMDDVYELKS